VAVIAPEPRRQAGDRPVERPDGTARGLSFRDRTTIALLAASLLPLLSYAAAVALIRSTGPDLPDSAVGRAALLALVGASVVAILAAVLLANDLLRPLRDLVTAVRTAADQQQPVLEAPGGDELAALADRYNRLAAELERRQLQLGRVMEAVRQLDPGLGAELLLARIADEARRTFDLISADVLLGAAEGGSATELVPGDPRPVLASLRVGPRQLGVLAGKLPATRSWSPADQLGLELYATGAALVLESASVHSRRSR
jgi:hypothetical protein